MIMDRDTEGAKRAMRDGIRLVNNLTLETESLYWAQDYAHKQVRDSEDDDHQTKTHSRNCASSLSL